MYKNLDENSSAFQPGYDEKKNTIQRKSWNEESSVAYISHTQNVIQRLGDGVTAQELEEAGFYQDDQYFYIDGEENEGARDYVNDNFPADERGGVTANIKQGLETLIQTSNQGMSIYNAYGQNRGLLRDQNKGAIDMMLKVTQESLNDNITLHDVYSYPVIYEVNEEQNQYLRIDPFGTDIIDNIKAAVRLASQQVNPPTEHPFANVMNESMESVTIEHVVHVSTKNEIVTVLKELIPDKNTLLQFTDVNNTQGMMVDEDEEEFQGDSISTGLKMIIPAEYVNRIVKGPVRLSIKMMVDSLDEIQQTVVFLKDSEGEYPTFYFNENGTIDDIEPQWIDVIMYRKSY